MTAKTGSQTIVGSLAGTTLGIALSTQLGDTWGAPLVLGFVSLSAVNLAACYVSLRAVALPTLSAARLAAACDEYVRSGYARVPTQRRRLALVLTRSRHESGARGHHHDGDAKQ